MPFIKRPETNVIKAVAKTSGTQTEAAKIKETILNWCKENTEGYQVFIINYKIRNIELFVNYSSILNF